MWDYECTIARVITRTGRFTVLAEREEDAEAHALKLITALPKLADPAIKWDPEGSCQSNIELISVVKKSSYPWEPILNAIRAQYHQTAQSTQQLS